MGEDSGVTAPQSAAAQQPETQTPDAEVVTVPGPPAPPPADKHLHQIDFVRLWTFAAVILDHVILLVATPVNVAASAFGLFLRYTRYSFFALTGFVLTYQYRHRELKVWPFWRRRYKLIGLPYIVWSLVYWTYGRYELVGFHGLKQIVATGAGIKTAIKSIIYDLLTGSAQYHLYFLSVSMQIYLVFPLILWVLRRTWGYHRYLLIVSGAFQALIFYLMLRNPLPIFAHGIGDVIWRHLLVLLITYQFFVLAGCVAAMHYEGFQAFMIRWRRLILGLGALTLLATLFNFLHTVRQTESLIRGTPAATSIAGDSPLAVSMFRASNTFLLSNSFAFIAIILILYVGGTIWQERRRPGSVPSNFMRTAADRSFGIYLAHALALREVAPLIARYPQASTGLMIIAVYAATVALTIFMVEVLRRSPISLITTGRSTIDWRKQNVVRCAVAGVVALIVGAVLREVAHSHAGDMVGFFALLLLASTAWVAWQQFSAPKVAQDS